MSIYPKSVKSTAHTDPFSANNYTMANFLAEHTPVPFERYRFAVAHEEMNSRRRNTMEDCHRILPTLGPDLETFSYFGIYDGHGGRQIVDFLEDAFEQNIIIELKEPDEASVLERLSRYLVACGMVNIHCF